MTQETNSAPAPVHDPSTDKKVMIGCSSTMLILSAICIAIGVFRLTPSLDTIRFAKASPDWPTTSAQVTFAHVDYFQGSHSDSGSSRWTPEVKYTYAVDGAEYSGDTIRYADLRFRKRGAREKAQAVLTPYSNYPTVTVSYNPENPQISVLEPGVTLDTFWMAIDSIGFIAIGVVILGFFIWIIFPRKSDKLPKSNSPEGL